MQTKGDRIKIMTLYMTYFNDATPKNISLS